MKQINANEIEKFSADVREIFVQKGVVSYDNDLFEKFLHSEKKNTLVTQVTMTDGKKQFFKAIKPWGTHRSLSEYMRGSIVYEIFALAKVTSYPRVYEKGKYKNVYYFFEQIVPIEETLSDKKVSLLKEADGKKIRSTYLSIKESVEQFMNSDQTYREVAFLVPQSIFSQQNSFLGQIFFFEKLLSSKGEITGTSVSQFFEKYVEKEKRSLYATDTLYLLHGDLSPHNIVYSDPLYFVDWERAIITQVPLMGKEYDLANLYVYTYHNPDFAKGLYVDTLSFRACVAYHCLYKANYLSAFGMGENRKLYQWCITTLKEIKL